MWLNKTVFGIRKKKIESVKFIWKYPPEDNGGTLAKSFDEMTDQIMHGLDNPDSCRQRAQQYLDKHMLGADKENCERIWQSVENLVHNQ